MTGDDFEGVEWELRALFADAEREVVGETLERLDVDLPFVEIEGRRYRRVLRSHATYKCGGRGGSASHAVPVREGTRGGADGVACGGRCGALDGAGACPRVPESGGRLS